MAFLGDTWSIYSGRILLLSLVILQYAYRANGVGPLCYECDHMPHQRDCGKIVRCGSHESCYGMKYVTTDSHVFYRSGCKDTSTCAVGKRADRTLCSSCCSGDFCNIQTCDQPVPLKHRCLACDYVISPKDCDLSKQCDDDEICYTEEVYNVNSEKRFRLGCARTSSCRSPPLPILAGKRDDISKRQTNSLPLTTTYCSKCCAGENCNRDLCNGTDSGTDLLVPPALLLCFDYDEVACRQLIANDPAPCFDRKIKNMLCPRTCGTCTGGGPVVGGGSTASPGQIPVNTPSTGSCVDSGDRCAIDAATTTLICNIQPQLCQKTCGLCSGSTLTPASTTQPAPTCNDPISNCQCKYLDEQLHLCDDPDPQVKMFCCYYCKRKHNTYTCPDSQCDTIEQQEFDRIQKLGVSVTCHSDIHK